MPIEVRSMTENSMLGRLESHFPKKMLMRGLEEGIKAV
jgi:hypothetical protein